jgi:tRNA threonylcarbamoyl adenosine modification protein (Sua5/YciO/YrdC/YwlC family)
MSGSRSEEFEEVILGGGVVLFPSDTVYGLACSAADAAAVERLYALKGRPPEKAAAVMFFSLDHAFEALGELGPRTREAMSRLLPGGVTLLLRNPEHRFALACGSDPGTLGLRVVDVPSLRGVTVPVLQSSANLSGGPDARRLEEVPRSVRDGVDLVVDGGELPGVPSTLIDLRDYESARTWSVLRLGAVGGEVEELLDGRFRFHPASYAEMMRAELPGYDQLLERLVAASGSGATRILDLGAGTGEASARVLAANPDATVVAVDESAEMLAAARERLGAKLSRAHEGMLQEALPSGPFDLVVSSLAIHHLDAAEKADLYRRLGAVVAPGGRFVLADVVVPQDPADASIELTSGYDKPSTASEQLAWLREAGFADASVVWSSRDLAVIVAEQTAGAGSLDSDE